MSSSDLRVILGQGLPRTTISSFPDELLIEIFDWCRLHDEYGWNYRRQWYNPLQVCRRWRYIMLESISRLRLRFLCNLANPIATIPSHLPPMPLVLSFNLHPLMSSHSKQGFRLALQRRELICALSITRWSMGGLELRRVFDNTFPMLETLSVSGYDYQSQSRILPNSFVAPRLRTLHLEHISISKGFSILANTTKLTSLRLEAIPDIEFFSPANLVEYLSSMPHLQNISFSLLERTPLPDEATELPHAQSTRIVLPSLSRLIYTGPSAYLDNILSRISTPFLQDFRFMSLSGEILDDLCLSSFLCTTQNLNLRTVIAQIYPHSTNLTYHPEQSSVGLPFFQFDFEHETSSQDPVLTSIAQICGAVTPALSSIVESLEIRLTTKYSTYNLDSGLFARRAYWHALFRLFAGVKTLMVYMDLAAELSDVLYPDSGAVIEELLPVLSEIVLVVVGFGKDMVPQPFSSFIHARRLSGQSIDIRVIGGNYTPIRPPSVSWSFDTFK